MLMAVVQTLFQPRSFGSFVGDSSNFFIFYFLQDSQLSRRPTLTNILWYLDPINRKARATAWSSWFMERKIEITRACVSISQFF